MPPRFLDTNVLLRFFTRDDEEKARAALALLQRVERGEETLLISPLVIFETVFTLQKQYGVPRPRIRELIATVLSLRGLHLSRKVIFYQALDRFVENNISFADAYNVAYLQAQALTEIYSWDRDFDKFAGITRLEPDVGGKL